jgi:ABC-type multidrug transport system fused ATPase/permease subunit
MAYTSLKELIHGRTTPIIVHRLRANRAAERILGIENGRIAAQGCHEALLRKEGRYFKLANARRGFREAWDASPAAGLWHAKWPDW